ncbi:MAG: RNA polymerase sigma factor [Patescibacteria group bacterium]
MFKNAEEKQLLARVNARDADAFAEVYDRYAARLFRHASIRLGRKEVAEDLTSRTFLKTWEYLLDGKTVNHIASFLYRVLHNLIVDEYRVRPREVLMEELPEPEDRRDANARVDATLELERVQRALRKLPDGTQALLTARYFDELSVGEICSMTGKSRNAAYVALHRGLRALQRACGERRR